MLLHRKILVAALIMVVGGSLSGTLAIAAYLHSDLYRHRVETRLSKYLGLQTQIDRIEPLSRHSRRFAGIHASLPDRQELVFSCERADWLKTRAGNEVSNNLHLYDGSLLLDEDRLESRDYALMLKSGLGHDFRAVDLAGVHLHDIDITWRQDGLAMHVSGAAGEVLLEPDGSARATLAARRLNDATVAEPIHIRADFTPGEGLVFHHVVLDVPRISLSGLGLEKALGGPVSSGWFAGTMAYHGASKQFTLQGSVGQAQLQELTRRLPGGPMHGTVDITLSQAVLEDGRLADLAFYGRLGRLDVGEVAAQFGQPDLTGLLDLHVHQAHFHNGQIEQLSATGRVTGLPMAVLTQLLGYGTIDGQLDVRIRSLIVVDNTIQWAEADVAAAPPAGGPGTISRETLVRVAGDVLNVDLAPWAEYLPEAVEYEHLGCRLVVDGDELRIGGLYGPQREHVLTVNLLGQEVPMLKAPDETYPVSELLAAARDRAAKYDMGRVRDWWEEQEKGKDK